MDFKIIEYITPITVVKALYLSMGPSMSPLCSLITKMKILHEICLATSSARSDLF